MNFDLGPRPSDLNALICRTGPWLGQQNAEGGMRQRQQGALRVAGRLQAPGAQPSPAALPSAETSVAVLRRAHEMHWCQPFHVVWE